MGFGDRLQSFVVSDVLNFNASLDASATLTNLGRIFEIDGPGGLQVQVVGFTGDNPR